MRNFRIYGFHDSEFDRSISMENDAKWDIYIDYTECQDNLLIAIDCRDNPQKMIDFIQQKCLNYNKEFYSKRI